MRTGPSKTINAEVNYSNVVAYINPNIEAYELSLDLSAGQHNDRPFRCAWGLRWLPRSKRFYKTLPWCVSYV